MRKKRILYINVNDSTFVKKDQAILSELYDVRVFNFHWMFGSKFYFLWLCIRLAFWTMINGFWCDIIFTRFADYYGIILGFFARIYCKKFVIVEGGIGAIAYKSINDGVYLNKYRGICASYALQSATIILPVDESLTYDVNEYTNDVSERIQGIIHYNPDINKDKIITLHNGYDGSLWYKTKDIEKGNTIVTTGNYCDTKIWIRKGGNYFTELAKLFPEYIFVLIGMDDIFKKKLESEEISFPANMRIHGYMNREEMQKIYSEAKVYVQLSITEGMPNSLCEAMLCECVPLGSSSNGIPNIIGNTGYIVNKQDINEMKSKLQDAVNTPEDKGMEARNRIVQEFSIEKRQQKLKEILDNL